MICGFNDTIVYDTQKHCLGLRQRNPMSEIPDVSEQAGQRVDSPNTLLLSTQLTNLLKD
jgi:hypothetical protein